MATISITEEKKKHVVRLIKSFKAIDSAILPYQEQRKELRKEYIENGACVIRDLLDRFKTSESLVVRSSAKEEDGFEQDH